MNGRERVKAHGLEAEGSVLDGWIHTGCVYLYRWLPCSVRFSGLFGYGNRTVSDDPSIRITRQAGTLLSDSLSLLQMYSLPTGHLAEQPERLQVGYGLVWVENVGRMGV